MDRYFGHSNCSLTHTLNTQRLYQFLWDCVTVVRGHLFGYVATIQDVASIYYQGFILIIHTHNAHASTLDTVYLQVCSCFIITG